MKRLASLADLTLSLQAYGPVPAGNLLRELGISRPTLSRLVRSANHQIERIGGSRNTRYALRRPVRGLSGAWPLHQIDAAGIPHYWGKLRALHNGRVLAAPDKLPAWFARVYPDRFMSGLPFFVQDSVPAGYLGRAIARAVSNLLNVPDDPRRWTDDDALIYLQARGQNLPGDVVLGETSLSHALSRADSEPTVKFETRSEFYPQLAEAAQRGEMVGSSAGGEQPKFLAHLQRGAERMAVMVKFSSAESSTLQVRWKDLLVCEHHAAQVISARGFASVTTDLIDAADRRFLEVIRFDRTPKGRRGFVSLGALASATDIPDFENWAQAADSLERGGWITPAAARELRFLFCFGTLIGNADMHRHNTGFWRAENFPFSLAPAYDMLPMQWAPLTQGDLPVRELRPFPPTPATADVWLLAADAAEQFWNTVSSDPRVSAGFRAIAVNCEAAVREQRQRSWLANRS